MSSRNRSHPRPWHRGSLFGDGPRHPLDRERRAVWKARIELHRRAGRITDGQANVGEALLKRLGQDGRCDPSHATLADDSGESVSTVQRALKAFLGLGMVSWMRRIVRDGWRACQTSNAYLLSLGKTPEIPGKRCDVQIDRETRREAFSFLSKRLSTPESLAAKAALEARQRVVEARLLTRGALTRPRATDR